MPISTIDDYFSDNPNSIGSVSARIIAGATKNKEVRWLYDDFVTACDDGKALERNNRKIKSLADNVHRRILATKIGKYIYPHLPDDVFYNEDFPFAHLIPQGWIFPDKNKNNIPVLLKDGGKGICSEWIIELYHAMAVADSSAAIVSILNFKTLQHLHFRVPRDKGLMQNIMALEAEFYSTVERRARTELEDI